jgi:hypothetical protein
VNPPFFWRLSLCSRASTEYERVPREDGYIREMESRC